MNDEELARAALASRLNCAEAVVSTFAARYGVSPETAIRVACGLGGGMGRTGNVCGAISGAVLVLGLAYGRSGTGDVEAKELTYAKVQELLRETETRLGSILCRDLLGADLNTREGRDRALEEKLFEKRCPEILSEAVEILGDLLP